MTKLFNITSEHVTHLAQQKIPLAFIWVMEQIKQGRELPEGMLKDHQWGQRKGYIDAKGKLTVYGEQLYDSLFKECEPTIRKKVMIGSEDDRFEEWWKTYPSTDWHETNGRIFKGLQKKHINKEECRRIFNTIVNGGQYTAEDIIKATEYNVETAKEISYKKGVNQLTFVTNSLRYLRERKFEPFIAISKQKVKEEFKGDTVI